MLRSIAALAASALIAATPATCAIAGPEWTTDFDAAKAEAKRSGRDLLIEFTGSDWCSWCIRLHDETLSTERFAQWASPKFLLVQLDYPRDTSSLAPEVIEQNSELRDLYSPAGFPTIVLADHEGMPYGRLVGYKPQDEWLAAAEAAAGGKAARDAAFERAAGLHGRNRATALRAALDGLSAADARAYRDLIAEIHRLEFPQADPADESVTMQYYLQTRRDRDKARPPGAVDRPPTEVAPMRIRPAAEAEAPAIEHNMPEFMAIMELLGGFGAGREGPDVESPEFQLGVARALAYRYRVGEWPAGAGGNRAVLALMAWAESQSDLALFEALLDEMPTVRRNLGGNEQFIGRLKARLDSLRDGTAEGAFYQWLLNRSADARG